MKSSSLVCTSHHCDNLTDSYKKKILVQKHSVYRFCTQEIFLLMWEIYILK